MKITSNSRRTVRTALAAAALAAAFSSAAHADPLGNVTTLTWTNNSTCPVGTQSIFNSATTNFRNAISGRGIPLSPNDSTIFRSEVTDAAFSGSDHNNGNADTADLAYVATHGDAWLNDCNPDPEDINCRHTVWVGQQTSATEPQDNDCIWGTPEMYLGNTRTNYFDLFACNSLELILDNDYQRDVAYGLHQWHGFTGTMATGTGTSTDLDDYIAAAHVTTGGAAYSWVNWETSYNHWGGTADVCATARTWGNNTTDAGYRATYENYTSREYFSDPGWDHSKTTWFGLCDPPSPLPGDIYYWPF